jgi:hypothetical protein
VISVNVLPLLPKLAYNTLGRQVQVNLSRSKPIMH